MHCVGRAGRQEELWWKGIFELHVCKQTAANLQQKLRKLSVLQWGGDNHPHTGSWDQMSSEFKQLLKWSRQPHLSHALRRRNLQLQNCTVSVCKAPDLGSVCGKNMSGSRVETYLLFWTPRHLSCSRQDLSWGRLSLTAQLLWIALLSHPWAGLELNVEKNKVGFVFTSFFLFLF